MAYEAKMILDSVGPNEARLTTFEFTYPRFVHAELMTHRVFSRNSASSRAIPTEKLLGRIEDDPVLPVWWGKNQSGMQAREELSDVPDQPVSVDLGHPEYTSPRSRVAALWRNGATVAIGLARSLGAAGLHKQIANRVVEPWMFITVVVTATEFSNFFALRDHGDAQPELAKVAGIAHELYRGAHEVYRVEDGGWHMPYVTGYDKEELLTGQHTVDELCRTSIGRCAAVSYLNQDKRDIPADLDRAKRNLGAGHMSPFEHVAQALTQEGWERIAHAQALMWIEHRVPVGNLWGWKQYRKTLPYEHDFGKISKR